MVPIHRVLDGELPVGLEIVLVDSGADFDLFGIGQADEHVDFARRAPEMLFQSDAGRAQAAEHESTILGDSRHTGQPVLFATEAIVVGFRIWHAGQRTVQLVRPTMVSAAEVPRVAARLVAYDSAPMAASIEQQIHLAGVVANHDHRLQSDALEAEIAGVRNFTAMPDEDPAAMENAFQLVLENLRVGVDSRIDAVGLYQGVVIDFRSSVHLVPPRRHISPVTKKALSTS